MVDSQDPQADILNPWQQEVLPDLLGGIRIDDRPDVIDKTETLTLTGVLFDNGQITVDKGYTTFNQEVVGTPQGTFQFWKTDGTSELVMVTTETVYVNTPDEWELISNSTSTTLSTSAADGATTISVDDATGFSAGDLIGVRINDGTQHQTTIDSISGSDITLDAGLDGAADSGNAVVNSVVLNSDLDEHVSFFTLASHNWLVFTNNRDVVKRYDGTDCIDIPGLADVGTVTAKGVTVFKDHLILVATTEDGSEHPQRIRWSHTSDPTRWTDGNASFADLVDTEDFLMNGTPLGSYMILYRDRSIVRMEYIGTDTRLFNFEFVVFGEGPVSPNGVVDMGDYHIFWGNTSIWAYTGGFDIEDVGYKIRPLVFQTDGDMNPAFSYRMFSAYIEELDECWFFYPSANADIPDKVLRMKPETQRFYLRDFHHTLKGLGFFRTTTVQRWIDLEGDWTEQTFRWNSVRLLANSPITLLCASDPKQVYAYDYLAVDDAGNVIQYEIESKDFTHPGFMVRIDHLAARMAGTGISIEYSSDSGETWTTAGSFDPGSSFITQRVHMGITVPRIRFKISGSGGGMRLSWLRFPYTIECPEE